MTEDRQPLDLYGGASWRESLGLRALGWKGVVALGGSLAILATAVGYGWMTSSAPVTVDRALEEFRAGSAQRSDAPKRPQKSRPAKRQRASKDKKTVETKPQRKLPATDQKSAPKLAAAAPANQQPAAQTGSREQAAPRKEPRSHYARTAPREGVYSWDTEGYESAGGARRSFPEESQRIVNRENGGWFQHHYFSEQREIWTRFRLLDEGAAIAMQRNKVTFGPVTNDATIDFAPPMLVGPRNLEVGQKWEGRWSGRTSGTYRGETFERVQLNIGGKQVEAWGIYVYMQMRGEIQGEVEARVWLAPKYAITVREHYKQRVKAGVSDYRAEWTMTLKSLQPQT